jgi:hypothetical protein
MNYRAVVESRIGLMRQRSQAQVGLHNRKFHVTCGKTASFYQIICGSPGFGLCALLQDEFVKRLIYIHEGDTTELNVGGDNSRDSTPELFDNNFPKFIEVTLVKFRSIYHKKF